MSPTPAKPFKNPRAKYNFQGRTCSITGVGSYVPSKVLTNADLEKMVDTSDEWITTPTGIKERRISAPDEFTSDMASRAALRAMKKAGVTAQQIDLIIVATITPDMPFPSTACLVQKKIGAKRAAAFDLEAACSGFIYGLEIAQQFIMSRTYDTVLVIGAEKLSAIVDWKDRNTCVLFGDGAGAAVLQNRPNSHGLLTAVMGADGEKPICSTCLAAAAAVQPRSIPLTRACITCAWTAKKPSRTPFKRWKRPLLKHCGAARSIYLKLNALFRTKRIAALSTRWASGWVPRRATLRESGEIRQYFRCFGGNCVGRSRGIGRVQHGDLILSSFSAPDLHGVPR